VVAGLRVLSKFLTKLLHLSIQELVLSIGQVTPIAAILELIQNAIQYFSVTPFWGFGSFLVG
jgi:uncharacterized membrane protein YwaF